MIGAYVVTICLAVVGTAIGLFIISMTGYALQRRDFPFRNGIMFYHLLHIAVLRRPWFPSIC